MTQKHNNKETERPNSSPGLSELVCVDANPGVCGFSCFIGAEKLDRQNVKITIFQSECKQIRRFSHRLNVLSIKELFTPITRNPVFINAEKSGCHPTCIIPTAVLKAAEVVMELALPREVYIRFKAGNQRCNE